VANGFYSSVAAKQPNKGGWINPNQKINADSTVIGGQNPGNLSLKYTENNLRVKLLNGTTTNFHGHAHSVGNSTTGTNGIAHPVSVANGVANKRIVIL
jgi:hypothetical protein